ncbi:hypothetical protein DIPPA_19595 [Diplonema papillatum]|nr:hypothetical protein DIPPA_19595 [Diplonema papillatum]
MLASLTLASAAVAFLPAQNPQWAPTYNMSMSSLSMVCNYTGMSDPKLGGSFGIASYDWSNAKPQWANQKPMDCEERLVQQADMTKKYNPATHVFLYRNIVKALPWFTTVRQKLDDPAYSGFFLKFAPNVTTHVPRCTGTGSDEKCSEYYHDQEQTPEHPTGDGNCADWCDCGANPCGEYLFDHRNGTMLRDFIVNDLIMGPNGVGHPSVEGMFLDDYWCSRLLNNSGCNGPSEIDGNNQADMGLSDQDILAITNGWLETMTAVEQAMRDAKAFTWWFFPGQDNANATPLSLYPSNCAEVVGKAVSENTYQDLPLLLGLETSLNQVEQEIAAFLIMRGPYAYVSYGTWGATWPATTPRPAAMDTDYGEPTAPAVQKSTHVFTRTYSKATVTLDCQNFNASIVMH